MLLLVQLRWINNMKLLLHHLFTISLKPQPPFWTKLLFACLIFLSQVWYQAVISECHPCLGFALCDPSQLAWILVLDGSQTSSLVCHISAHSSLSFQLLTGMLIILLMKDPCRSTYKDGHQIPEVCSFKLYFQPAGCVIFLPMSINFLLWVSCDATENLTEVKKYLDLVLPTYPPGQRLFFRSSCWLFSVLLMSSE